MRPMSDHGATHLRNTRSYQSFFVIARSTIRVRIAAANGIPRKAATLVETVEYEGVIPLEEWLMTLMKRMARGA